jgi:2-hydroxy-6-oxonona-2,4-dienedioate hydrolase
VRGPGGRRVASRRIVSGGVGIRTRTVGEGDPVVLVHGFGVSGRYMLPLAEALARWYSVFIPDLPGSGRSQKPPTPLGIGGLAESLAGCLDALKLQRPAFVANSLGCQVVTELAVRLPERVGPLTLIGPTIDPDQRRARHQLLRAVHDLGREPISLLTHPAKDGVMGVRALLTTARSALADRIEDRLPLIEQSTLVLRGSADSFVSAAWAERVAALLPRSRLVVVPGEPHALHYTRPDLVGELVRDLLLAEGHKAGDRLFGSASRLHVAAQ